ncbi:MAG: hypothetical protein LC107_12725 [Chitinophagales bacterium]|nr:hypothetical protein [Chitinophagales bacterium]
MNRKDSLFSHLFTTFPIRYFIVLVILTYYNPLSAQLHLNFDDGNINNVVWIGDISHFKINNAGQLQLSTTGAGESSIFTKYKVPDDSIQIDLYFKMQFAPSNDNHSKIYLMVDRPEDTNANGYYLKLGENGNNDAVQLYKLVNGNATLLGAGTNGAIATDPAQARLQIKLYRNGMGTLYADYSGQQILEEELDFLDPNFSLPDSLYFGIFCKYTTTRSDKFFYDDIHIKTIEQDTVPPRVVSAQALNNKEVKIAFSERPDAESVIQIANYNVDHGLNQPEKVIYNASTPLEAILQFRDNAIKSNIVYTLSVAGLKDAHQNHIAHQVQFFFTEKPDVGDLVINEVLTDPLVGGEDFIELYNKSEKLIKLDSLIIANLERNESRVIRTDFTLKPGGYVVLSKNIAFLKETYQTPDSAAFIETTIPAMNVASANITIQTMKAGKLINIDSFDYKQNMHFKLLNNTKGISLERIRPEGLSNDANNWHSAAAETHYGTPGYRNSNFTSIAAQDEADFVFIDKKVITPDGNGIDDLVLIQYQLEKSGYLATVRIYDSEGFPILDLAKNTLLGTESTLKWDGLNAENNLVKTGMYIIYSRVFHPDGEVKTSKKVVVVAHQM